MLQLRRAWDALDGLDTVTECLRTPTTDRNGPVGLF